MKPAPQILDLAASALLAACATTREPTPTNPPPLTGTCNADPASFGVGQPYTAALGERMKAAAQARTLRVLRPGQVVTLEFSPSRLGVDLDDKDVVTRVRCG